MPIILEQHQPAPITKMVQHQKHTVLSEEHQTKYWHTHTHTRDDEIGALN